jgi:hypothetical protein
MPFDTTSGVPGQLDTPIVSGPEAAVVLVPSILFSSLGSTPHSRTCYRNNGSIFTLKDPLSTTAGTRTQCEGVTVWRFKLNIERLPLIMPASLLLLGYVLVR